MSGYILYAFLFLILISMWRRVRGQSFYDLLARSAREHHLVQEIATKHPYGGTWREFKRWMQEEEDGLTSTAKKD